jgi:hypothetical protein
LRPGGLERERPCQVSRHVVIAKRGQQHRTGAFRARAEFLEHLLDERRLAAGVQVRRACICGRCHGGPADLHERPSGRHEHVTATEQLPQLSRLMRARDGRLQLSVPACLCQPGSKRVQPPWSRPASTGRIPLAIIARAVSPPI